MRDEKITIAKGIAIILMVVAHAGLPHVGGAFIYMFHMPLFFFVSGYCFKDKYLANPKRFAVNKVKGLYVPFVKWSLIFLVLHNVFFYLNIYNGLYGFKGEGAQFYTMMDFAKKLVRIVVTMVETESLLGGYWFLKQLLLGSFLAFGCFKYAKSDFWGASALLVIAIAAAWWNLSIPFFRVGSLTFFSGFFIVMGRAYKRINVDADKWWVTFAAFMVVAVGSVWCNASMLKYTAAQILPYSACAILGTIMVLNLSHLISLHQNVAKRVLMFVGDHTLEVLTWHFLTFKIVSLLIIWIHGLPVLQLGYFPTIEEYATWYWPLYSLFGIGLPIGVVYIRKKILYGEKTK